MACSVARSSKFVARFIPLRANTTSISSWRKRCGRLPATVRDKNTAGVSPRILINNKWNTEYRIPDTECGERHVKSRQ